MKVLLCSALLLSGLAFGRQSVAPKGNVVIKCAKKCGASTNAVNHVNGQANFCARVRLMQGCFCGTMQQVNSQIQQCKKKSTL